MRAYVVAANSRQYGHWKSLTSTMVTRALSAPLLRPASARGITESMLAAVGAAALDGARRVWPQAVVASVAVSSRAAAPSVEMRIIVVRERETSRRARMDVRARMRFGMGRKIAGRRGAGQIR